MRYEKQYSNWQMLKDLAEFVRPYKWRFWAGTAVRFISDVIWLYPIWAMSEIITFATTYESGASLDYFWFLMGSVVLIAIWHFIWHDWAKYLIYPIAERVSIDAQTKTLRHIFSLDSAWQQKENSGNKIKRISTGGESMNKIIRVYVDLVIESSVNLVGISVILWTLSWQLNLMLVTFYVTYYLLSYYYTKKASEQSHIANVEWEKFDGVMFEMVNHVATVKALGIGDQIMPWLKQISKKLMKEIKKRIVYFRMRGGVLNLYQELFRQSMILFTVWQVFKGEFEVGAIALVLLYFGKMRESAHEFAETYHELIIGKIKIMRMKEILDEEPVVENLGTKRFKRDWKEMIIDDVNFAYGGRQVLSNFSLKIKRGEKVGIVGISGTGKSTLFKLLLKLYDDYSGEIRFDELALRDIKRESYVEHTAVVPQETELFNLSLEQNITIANTGRDGKKQALAKAVEIAHIDDFLPRLDNGLDTLIGEKGVKLSGGERQRVGIGRAVYREPDILFMDEATSHLDVDSEKKIQDALHHFFEGITAIVIAHRLSTIKEMDRIVVMQDGRVLEQGSFEELIKANGEFKRLWERQQF